MPPLADRGATPVRVMTVAGSDSGGGAGIQADLRTFAMLGVHGCVAVTAVTVQNTVGVSEVSTLPPQIVAAQMRSVVTDIGVTACKTGMLSTSAVIDAVADAADDLDIGRGRTTPLVVDPVCASMHGDQLLATQALDTLRAKLFPRASVVTPNLDEVRLITGIDVVDAADQRRAAHALLDLGAQWVVVKGGHLRGAQSADLVTDGGEYAELTADRIPTPHDHGAGDTLAAAMTVALAHGYPVRDAVEFSKRWVTECLRWAYPLGAGHGPVSPLWRLQS